MKFHVLVLMPLMLYGSLFSQEFRVHNFGAPESLDPATSPGEGLFYLAIFEGLAVNNPRTAKGEPGLAESWKVTNGGRTYTFKLRKAVWSDGTPITAQTVVDSWYRTLDPKMRFSSAEHIVLYLEGAKAYLEGKGNKEDVKIKAIDPRTFEATFITPGPYIIDMLTRWPWVVVPTHAIQKFGEAWTKPGNFVGSGPFLLQEWKSGDRITVVKNDRYWDAKNVKLKRITFFIDEGTTAYDRYKAGEIDWLPTVGDAKLEEIKQRPDFHLTPGRTVYYYIFNVTRKPFDDVRVRKAFSMALDRKILVEQILKGSQIPTAGFVPCFGTYRTAKGNPFNPDQARKLLAEAGYPGGKGFPRIEVICNTNPNHTRVLEWARQQWKTVLGVDCESRVLDWEPFMALRADTHDFFMARAGWNADYPDPMNFLGDLLTTGSADNDGLYSNLRAEAILGKANQLPPGLARDRVLAEVEDIMITQDQAVLPLYFNVWMDLIDLGKWGGWYPNTMGIEPYKFVYRK